MSLYDLMNRVYETQKYTIHLTRHIQYEGLGYERTDTIHDVESIGYKEQTAAKVMMFAPKAKGHLEVWAIITKEEI